MIKLITGKKGTGKTKILIDQINDAVKSTNGNLVCIEKGDNIRRSISFRVRWCDTESFAIEGADAFYGFVAGMLAGNYDIKDVFVDGILKIVGRDYDVLGNLFEKLDKLTGEEATVVFTVSADDSELPESVKQFIK
ncbi:MULTISPECIES: hypothetical protein [Ruminococcus]|jgi:archaellum biogenesis ATPase FlaH|uniref:Twitching motility protein PilT n=1 Tax=Ruminococcus flavefaciens TaxID=1265 RepID=A0A315Y575_RUMFL|nr:MULTISPECIES: hypothetical protein [Ruminococcus]MBR1430704.1 hypothetical protein [Ruminococcus sp.]PWJ15148.1 hypothetical protein IE37_00039 [Ruminococcus flavefaciens]SSA40172.1 hypothetical protein SAMN02910325_00039 [Ruminococcus flavefaciens]